MSQNVCDASLVDATFPSCRQAPDVKKAERADQQHGKPAGPTLSTTQLVENHRTRCRTSARRRGVRGSRPDQSAGRTGRDRSQADLPQPSSDVRFVPILLQKSFCGDERNFLEPLMRFTSGDVRGHIGSHKKRPRSFAWVLRSIAVMEPAKNQLLRDFRRRSIFDFCNMG